MAIAHLDGTRISDWPSFHGECREAFGFPDFYGNNMDAWIDCLSYLRDDEGMTKFRLAPDEILQIDISNAELMRKQAPDILDELAFCIGLINERYDDYGEKPALELILR
jgi:hypothetical protein